MQAQSCDQCSLPCALRVLIIDDEPSQRELHAELLRQWCYIPFIAEGSGETLIADALHKAQKHRCHLALVDMRLRDNDDRSDRSGLELVPSLQPTAAIIVSGFGDRKTVRDALKDYGALDFVGKEDHPEALRRVIKKVAPKLHLCYHQSRIVWSGKFSSLEIRDLLYPNNPEVPADQVDDLIGKLFPNAERVVLTVIGSDDTLSERLSAPRRQSRVFRVAVDDQGAMRIAKLARVDKIKQEIQNYDKYVKDELLGDFRAEKVAEALLWDLGAVAYRQIGNPGLGYPGNPETLTNYYRSVRSAEEVLPPLYHFFHPTNWGRWYLHNVVERPGSLFEDYDTVWKNRLSKQFENWQHHEPRRSYPHLSFDLPNPTRWLVDQYQNAKQVQSPRQAVTHGDLHADNLFVDTQHSWPIDFERTGRGPILRDFVELIQDLLTRVAPFEPEELPLFYELAVAICMPLYPGEHIQPTPMIQEHAEAFKVFQVINALQQLAYERTRYIDRREYLWGLLLNCLLVFTLLEDRDLPHRTRTLLLASLICDRLEHWNISTTPEYVPGSNESQPQDG